MSAATVEACGQCAGEGVVGGELCPKCEGSGEVEVRASVDTISTVQEPAWDGQERRAVVAPADPVTTALVEVTHTNAKMPELAALARELAEKSRGVVADVRTVKGYAQIAAIRTELREKARFPMQRLKESGSKMLGTMQRQFNARAEELIEEVKGFETPFQEQLDAEDTRKENERKERQRLEDARKQGHLDALAAISRHVIEASGEGSTELQARITGLGEMIVDESWEEYQGQAQQAKDEALRQLQGMLVAAKLEEAELEETRRQQAALKEAQDKLAAQQKEMDDQRAAMAEQQRQMDAQRAAMEAEREANERARAERAQAVENRIEQFTITAASYSHMAASADLRSAIATMHDTLITEAMFDARTGEARTAKDAAIADLTLKYDLASEREAEEARQQQAARVQELINSIISMGHNAALAVEDGSADVTQLQNGLHNLETLDLSELMGGRFEEANRERDAAIASTMEAITATKERDRLRAEEAEQRRIVNEHQEHMNAMARRAGERAGQMFNLLKELAAIESSGDIVALSERAAALVKEIEGDSNA